jgi:hypothetical protein
MNKSIIYWISTISLFIILAFATIKEANALRMSCLNSTNPSYLIYGQSHNFVIHENETCVFIHFSKNTTYYITACCKQNTPFNLQLFDKNDKLLFADSTLQTNQTTEFEFDNDIDCKLKLSKDASQKQALVFNLLIGFKTK